jgi:amino acid transporter
LNAVGYLALNYPNKVPAWFAGFSPYWAYGYLNFLIGNVPLAAIVSIAFILQISLAIAILIIATSRFLFAWSFDRIIPAKFAEVSERFSTPLAALIFGGILTMIGYSLTVYTSYLNFAVGAPLGIIWSLAIASFAALIFKWRKKEIYEKSTVSRLKLGNLPLQPVIAFIALVAAIFMIIEYLGPVNALAVGGLGTLVTEMSFGVLAIGIAAYFIAQKVQASRGIDVRLAFVQIPPE